MVVLRPESLYWLPLLHLGRLINCLSFFNFHALFLPYLPSSYFHCPWNVLQEFVYLNTTESAFRSLFETHTFCDVYK